MHSITPKDAKRIYEGLLCNMSQDPPFILSQIQDGSFAIVHYNTGRIVWVSERSATYAEAIVAAEDEGYQVEGSSIIPLLRSNDCLLGRHDKCRCPSQCECWCHKVPAWGQPYGGPRL
jgi:hypothetical protein